MQPGWESRKRLIRFILPVTQSASMSACFFQAEKVLSSFFPSPMSSRMKCSAVRNPGIGDPLPDRLNWRPCSPDMCPAWHEKGRVSENCLRSTMLNILTVISCLLSNGQSASISFTSRLSAMSNTMPQTRCTLILPVTGLKSLMR